MPAILVIEDNVIEQIRLRQLLKTIGYEDITCVPSTQDARKVMEHQTPDLLISDVFLQGETSPEFIQQFSIPAIFITTSKDLVIYESLVDKHKYAYLIKPLEAITLYSTINLLLTRKEEEESTAEPRGKAILVRQGNKQILVPFSDILWLESEGNYTFIRTETAKYALKQSLRRTADLLPPQFIQTHQRYIVNLDQVITIKPDSALVHEHEIPVTKLFKKAFRQAFREKVH